MAAMATGCKVRALDVGGPVTRGVLSMVQNDGRDSRNERYFETISLIS